MKKLLYPVVILAVVAGYAKIAKDTVGAAQVKTMTAMLTTDLGKALDAVIDALQTFVHKVFS